CHEIVCPRSAETGQSSCLVLGFWGGGTGLGRCSRLAWIADKSSPGVAVDPTGMKSSMMLRSEWRGDVEHRYDGGYPSLYENGYMRTQPPPMAPIFRSAGQARLLAAVLLTDDELSVTELAERADLAYPTAHREVARLLDAGILTEQQ